MGAFFHNHLMRHIPHPGGGHQKTHAVADIVQVVRSLSGKFPGPLWFWGRHAGSRYEPCWNRRVLRHKNLLKSWPIRSNTSNPKKLTALLAKLILPSGSVWIIRSDTESTTLRYFSRLLLIADNLCRWHPDLPGFWRRRPLISPKPLLGSMQNN